MSDMLFLNHPTGQADAAMFRDAPTVDLDRIAGFAMPGAIVHNGLFEIPYRQVTALLPASLHPATPAYASLMFIRAPQSPFGPMDIAILGVACRTGIRPRMLTAAAFASSPEAVAALRAFGFDAQLADVDTLLRYDAAASSIRRKDGELLVSMSTPLNDVLLGSTRAIRFPQPLNRVTIGGEAGLLQFDMAFEYDEGWRGALNLPTFDPERVGSGKVDPTDLIGGTVSKVNITVQHPRLLLDAREVGKAVKIAAPAGA